MATLLRLLIIAGIIWLVYSFIKRALNNSSHQLNDATMRALWCSYCGR